MKIRLILGMAALAVAVGAASPWALQGSRDAFAAGDAAASIQARQQDMKTMGGQLRTINAFAKGEASDQAAALAAIDTVLGIAATLETKFPAGSGLDSVTEPKTGAKPEIWSDPAKFKAAIGTFTEQATAMKTAISGGDQAAMQAAFASLGKTGCGTCHSSFRAKID